MPYSASNAQTGEAVETGMTQLQRRSGLNKSRCALLTAGYVCSAGGTADWVGESWMGRMDCGWPGAKCSGWLTKRVDAEATDRPLERKSATEALPAAAAKW